MGVISTFFLFLISYFFFYNGIIVFQHFLLDNSVLIFDRYNPECTFNPKQFFVVEFWIQVLQQFFSTEALDV